MEPTGLVRIKLIACRKCERVESVGQYDRRWASLERPYSIGESMMSRVLDAPINVRVYYTPDCFSCADHTGCKVESDFFDPLWATEKEE